MVEARTDDLVVDEDTLHEAVSVFKRLPADFTIEGIYAADIVRMLRELIRHRDREDDAYWGEDDD